MVRDLVDQPLGLRPERPCRILPLRQRRSADRASCVQETIVAVRAASRNAALAVLVGGPPFVARPEVAVAVGADGTASNGKEAPLVAERLLSNGRLRKK